MSVEAMWQVTFGAGSTEADVSVGAGIVVLESGKIFGGDSWFYYTGTYEVEHGLLVVHVRSRRHAEGGESVAGSDDETLILSGQITDQVIMLNGNVASDTNRVAAALLKRLAELP